MLGRVLVLLDPLLLELLLRLLEGDGRHRGWQGEDHMEVRDRQQVGLALFEPGLSRLALTLGAVTVTAGVVAHRQTLTGLAAGDVAAELGGAAGFDGRHDLELAKAQAPGMGPAEGLAVGA